METLTITPSQGVVESFEHKVSKLDFGDGYSKVASVGINAKKLTRSLPYTNLTEAKKDELFSFCFRHGVSKPFIYNGKTYRLSSEPKFSQVGYNAYSTTLELLEAFEL